MESKTIAAALEAVQAAMKAEVAAQAAFLGERSLAKQAIWSAARMRTDAAWAALWELNKEHVPQRRLSGAEWARSMRQNPSSTGSASGSGSSMG